MAHKYGTVGYLVDALKTYPQKAKLEFATGMLSPSLDVLSIYDDRDKLNKKIGTVFIDLGGEDD